MVKPLTVLFLATSVSASVNKVYTGFNYGAFWGEAGNAKKYADFHDSFDRAKNLSSPVPFNSARLYTCKEQGTTTNESTGAFQAAVETKTNLLLGFWITPATRDASLTDIINREIAALAEAFKTHGQPLADLIIGLSVGNEDVYRYNDSPGEVGVSASGVAAAIKTVRESIAKSSFAHFMEGKPIGHVDTVKHVVVEGADFYGITAYPYWNNETVAKAKESFTGSLESLKQRAGNTPIWIAEMGWPVQGPVRGEAVASMDNLQNFWDEVGCAVVGRYNTFWFELLQDSQPDQPDWAVLDSKTYQPRVDFRCSGDAQPSAPTAPTSSAPASPPTVPTTLLTVVSPCKAPLTTTTPSVPPTMGTSVPAPTSTPSVGSMTHKPTSSMNSVQPTISAQPSTGPSVPISPSASSGRSTTHVVITSFVTVPSPEDTAGVSTSTVTITETITEQPTSKVPYPSAPAGPPGNSTTPSPGPVNSTPLSTNVPSGVPWCVTVADIEWNGKYVPVDGHPPGPDGKCSPAPTYTGMPYGTSQPAVPPQSASKTPTISAAPSSHSFVPPTAPTPSSSAVVAPSSTPTPVPSSSALPTPPTLSASVPSTSTSLAASNSPTSSSPSQTSFSPVYPSSTPSAIIPSSSPPTAPTSSAAAQPSGSSIAR
jgi:glucan endo-1,3-beta-D-glucosidase